MPSNHPGWFLKQKWDFLAIQDQYSLIVYNDCIFVLEKARKNILENLHIQHTGQNKTYQNAKQLYFWSTMRNKIKQMVETCPEYIRMLLSQSAEKQIQTVTSVPMEAISVDLDKEAGVHYLIGAD